MDLLAYYNSIDLSEIQRFVEQRQEESLTIEFKSVNHPEPEGKQYDKKNFSKILSGFANSSGGIVVWGIKAAKDSFGIDVASELKPIKELTRFLNYLNMLEGQAVTPFVAGIIHEKIENKPDEGFIKTYVPSSEAMPHMANYAEKHYYKRSGDSFYQCEHFDIVDMFSRKRSPKLEFVASILAKKEKHSTLYTYAIMLSLKNYGAVIAKYPYLAIKVDPFLHPKQHGLDGNSGTGLKRVKNNILYHHNYSGGSEMVVYPGALLNIDILEFDLPKEQTPRRVTIDYEICSEDMESVKGTIVFESEVFLKS